MPGVSTCIDHALWWTTRHDPTAVDLTDPTVLGRTIIVQSTNRIFVEQSFPSGRGDLRVSSWAIPAE